MKTHALIVAITLLAQISYSQVYINKQSRHRFAQLNMGLDVQSSFGGSTHYLDGQGEMQKLSLTNTSSPRFIIGGTHFWGHADFYIAIPLYDKPLEKDNQEITTFRAIETVFKYYPLRIENHKLRPYIGTSIAPIYFQQKNNHLDYPNGLEATYTALPLLSGITFNSGNHLIDLGVAWDYSNKQKYHISNVQQAQIQTPPVYVNLSYRYMLETTIGEEKNWESGRTKKMTDDLAEEGRLNGFYIGAGISSAFWLKQSSYNQAERPYIDQYTTSIMLDITGGYYLHKPDLNMAIGYRSYGTSADTYGAIQQLNRKSVLMEVTKCLFDYHGFVPFVGPAISYEKLSFEESFEGKETVDIEENKLGYGLTFGWDIRPNRIQSWILRTNLRWYPNLFLDVDANSQIFFDNLEFNFIQLIIYLKKRRSY